MAWDIPAKNSSPVNIGKIAPFIILNTEILIYEDESDCGELALNWIIGFICQILQFVSFAKSRGVIFQRTAKLQKKFLHVANRHNGERIVWDEQELNGEGEPIRALPKRKKKECSIVWQ